MLARLLCDSAAGGFGSVSKILTFRERFWLTVIFPVVDYGLSGGWAHLFIVEGQPMFNHHRFSFTVRLCLLLVSVLCIACEDTAERSQSPDGSTSRVDDFDQSTLDTDRTAITLSVQRNLENFYILTNRRMTHDSKAIT